MTTFTSSTAWLPILAQLPSNPAERAGFIVGLGIGVLAVLGLLAFFIVAIVKAFTKKTTGWIIAGSISGLLVAFLGVAVVIGFITGFKRGFEGARERAAAVAGKTAPAETITGGVLPFTIEKPGGWYVKRKEGAYDVVLSNNTDYVGVIAEEADLGGAEKIAQFARKRVESMGSEVTLGDNEPITIDGHQWVAFTVHAKIQNLPFAYQYYVYSGKEGSLQIMGWTFQNLWDRESATLRQAMQTFRFPPVKEAAPKSP